MILLIQKPVINSIISNCVGACNENSCVNGKCVNGRCEWNEGFFGATCEPRCDNSNMCHDHGICNEYHYYWNIIVVRIVVIVLLVIMGIHVLRSV